MSVASLDHAVPAAAPGLTLGHYLRALRVIITREGLRFVYQRGRFISALVRPLVWLFIFAAGFRSVLGVSIQPPYVTYILYEVYITPGLCGMILLFAGMQSSLAMVYDREMGSMRVLLVSPLPAGTCCSASCSPARWSPWCSATCSSRSRTGGRWSRRSWATSRCCRR